MSLIHNLLEALDERVIARTIGVPHDEARMAYALRSNTVANFDAFEDAIAGYFNYAFTRSVSHGGSFSRTEAAGRAKEIIERAYRRRNGNLITAYNDAHDGTNGGMRHILDLITEALRTEATERYVRQVFDTFVTPNSWEQKVELIRQFIEHCGPNLSSSIRRDQPERYASDFQELIRAYSTAMQQTAAVFRRL